MFIVAVTDDEGALKPLTNNQGALNRQPGGPGAPN